MLPRSTISLHPGTDVISIVVVKNSESLTIHGEGTANREVGVGYPVRRPELASGSSSPGIPFWNPKLTTHRTHTIAHFCLHIATNLFQKLVVSVRENRS